MSSNSSFERPALEAHSAASRERFEDLLRKFVEIPSVSNDPARKDDIHRMVDLAGSTLIDFGFESRVLKTKGNPILHGRRVVDANAPTVTIYNHLDVQPGGEASDWKTDPFVFTRDGERWYGRGATDDKGPALTALFGARYALDHGAKVNVSFLWELEEEIGSPSFEAAVRAEAGALRTDAVCVSDTIWISRERPACPAGLRGLQGFLLRLETGATDQHSGTTGGAARNPIAELMGVVCACLDPKTGKVKIPGFYEGVIPPTKEEIDGFKKSGFSVAAFKKDHKLKSLRVNDRLEVMKRIWAMPTFEVHGVTGGYTGPQIKTIVPPRGEVKCSVRLVPKQDPKKVLGKIQKFVKKVNPDVEVVPVGSLAAYRGVTTGPWADAVKDSMAFAFGRPPVFVREGGSIGAVLTMEKVLGCPIVFLGLSLPEHGYHAPNENYDWGQARGGMTAFAKFFEQAASMRGR
ncbi:MAG: M20/M25/M40 family metallo-hydrolase [Planctomycetes bacterium]|nr:M20/M25/M40 family metallo-hydrolase [Planctomycetota bacterium]